MFGRGVDFLGQLGELHLVVHHQRHCREDNPKAQHRRSPPQEVPPWLAVLFQLFLGQLHHVFLGALFGLLPGLFLRLGVVPPGIGDALLGGGALLEQGKIVGF